LREKFLYTDGSIVQVPDDDDDDDEEEEEEEEEACPIPNLSTVVSTWTTLGWPQR